MIRRFWTDDWFDWNTNFTFGELVDTRRYDIINGERVPRKDYQDSLLKQKDKELKELEDYYEKRKKEIADERKALTG